MIGYLKGSVQFVDAEEGLVVIDVGGVGYEVHATAEAMRDLTPDDEAALVIHTLVREEEITLYGFSSRMERSLFELLNSVSGVGPRTALTVLSHLGSEGFIDAVATGNTLPFKRAKGVGPRTAERIILELRDKLGKALAANKLAVPAGGGRRLSHRLVEVEQALLGLGFRRPDVVGVLNELKDRSSDSVEELIRESLKRLK